MATHFITVSIGIMHDQNLSATQKFILAEIEQLSTLEKGCIAQNSHFSNLIGISKVTVSRAINDLITKGYIEVIYEAGSRNHTRVIKMIHPPYQIDTPPLSKRYEAKENKTINKTSNSKKSKKVLDFTAIEIELCTKHEHSKIEMKYPLNFKAYQEFVQHRAGKHNPVTKQGALKQIKLLCRYPKDIQAAMVDKSIVGGYAGLFEIKKGFDDNRASSNTNGTKDTIDRTFKRGKYAEKETIDTEVIDG